MLDLTKFAALCAGAMLLASCGGGGGGGAPSPAQRKQPPKHGDVQKILLIWQAPEWKVLLPGPGQQPVKPDQARTKLDPAPNVGPTRFEVTFQGAGTNLTKFKEDGLSVWEGTKLPTQLGVKSTQIIGPFVMNEGKLLVFYDLNYGDKVTLNYALHFNDKPTVDPIIENGGGDWP